jgi:hypothetical protein
MEKLGDSEPRLRALTVRLSESDYEILERFRGDLSPDAFMSALLRMIDTSAVVTTPDRLKGKDAK